MNNLHQAENKIERVIYFFPPNHFDRNVSKQEFCRRLLESINKYKKSEIL